MEAEGKRNPTTTSGTLRQTIIRQQARFLYIKEK
jgi:hypothetical protein